MNILLGLALLAGARLAWGWWRGRRGAQQGPALLLLLESPREIEPEALRVRLSERFFRPFGDAPGAKDVVTRFGPDALGVMVAGVATSVETHAEPLADPETLAKQVKELRRQDALRRHRAWIGVRFSGIPSDLPHDEAYRVLGRVAAEVAGDDTLALVLPETGAVVPWDAQVAEALRRGDPLGATSGAAPMAAVSADDPRLAEARAEALRRWPEFAERFANRRSHEAFAVKARFEENGSAEHMWLVVEGIEGERVRGRLDNAPTVVKGLRTGDPVEVQRADVDDWVVRAGDELVGGFSVQVLLERVRG